ncbi:hypothetical protein [Catenulispora rubra]|uniref:hypothetical protein n=1 Tax=Catenulispora rubra TaxID=280293 RepID=UPI0018922131|nr:hypothetical protein [Catenulispora rubra]
MNRVEDRGRPGHPQGRQPTPPVPSHPTIDDYERAVAAFRQSPNPAVEFGYLREVALVGARLGTIRPADIVRHVCPAAVAVTLVMEPEIVTVGDAVTRAILRGDSAGPQYWARMVREVDTARTPLAALVKARPDSGRGVIARGLRRSAQDERAAADMSGQRWRAANVVLALAPPLAARAFLASGATMHKEPSEAERTALREQASLILDMASQAPLCRELVGHAFGSLGDTALRMRLAENPFTPDSVLARLACEHDTEPEVTRAVQVHEFAGGTARRLAFQAVRDEPEAVLRGLRAMLRLCGEEAFLEMVEAAPQEQVAWVRSVVAAAGPDLTPATRLRSYVRLAELSAPEVAWAVELNRAGSLERMMPVVRASMAEGTAQPMLAAVREDKAAAAAARRVAARSAGRVGGARSGRGAHLDPERADAHGGRSSAQAQAERHRVAAAEMKRWRSEGALDDPVPLV